MKSSGWSYAPRLRELNAAQKWGCPSPGFYDNLSYHERVEIVTWYEATWRMDAINSHEMQQKAKAKAKANKRKR